MTDRTAIVTGGARRIGAAISRHLHEAGLNVIIHYHTSESAAGTLYEELNSSRAGSAYLIRANLSNTDFDEIIQTATEFTGRLDVLVNNASVFISTPPGSTSEEDWKLQIDLNLKAPLFLSRSARHILAKHQGCIINISDIYANVPLRNYAVYSMTKSGLTSLTRTLARELAPDIRVNAIAPGAILWPEGVEEKHKQQVLQSIPLQRAGDPLDIARSVAFLVNEADYLTGQVITIDGGRQLRR